MTIVLIGKKQTSEGIMTPDLSAESKRNSPILPQGYTLYKLCLPQEARYKSIPAYRSKMALHHPEWFFLNSRNLSGFIYKVFPLCRLAKAAKTDAETTSQLKR